jgi:hypothetical protein
MLFSLPRELRDQIYLETLSDIPDIYSECPAEQDPKNWYFVRKTAPGFFRPIIHEHNYNGNQWDHRTTVVDKPALFQITDEAIDVYIKDHVMLEMTVDDCNQAIDDWQDQIGDANVQMIRTLFIMVHSHAMLEGKTVKLPEQTSYLRGNDELEIGGPIFRVDIRGKGTELVLSARSRLEAAHKRQVAARVEEWAKKRSSSEGGYDFFTGKDAVAVAKLLPHCASAVNSYEVFSLFVKEGDIVDIVHYKCDGIERSELQITEQYPDVVAHVKIDRTELVALEHAMPRLTICLPS